MHLFRGRNDLTDKEMLAKSKMIAKRERQTIKRQFTMKQEQQEKDIQMENLQQLVSRQVRDFKKDLVHKLVYLQIARMPNCFQTKTGSEASPIVANTLNGDKIALLYQEAGYQVGYEDGYALYRDLIKEVKKECRDSYHFPKDWTDDNVFWGDSYYLSSLLRQASARLASGPVPYLKYYERETKSKKQKYYEKRKVAYQGRQVRKVLDMIAEAIVQRSENEALLQKGTQ